MDKSIIMSFLIFALAEILIVAIGMYAIITISSKILDEKDSSSTTQVVRPIETPDTTGSEEQAKDVGDL